MRSGSDVLEEVRRRTDLVQVVSGYVKLRKNGQRLIGLCPFHPEKTPSFSVHPEKQVWHCFGCGEGGDVFSFVERIEHLSFREALEKLAARCGVEVSRESPAERGRRQRGQDLLEQAAAFYQHHLARSRKAQDYLRQRGIAPSAAQRFGLGYAPDAWESLRTFLIQQGATDADMAGAGLVKRREGGSGGYDLFRDRLIFPIWDASGRVIAFGGRSFGDAQPKYLNSPESEHFSKSRVVYALHLARDEIKTRGEALMMEGYMDVLAAHQHGFAHAVATLGTAITLDHLRTLRRLTDTVVLVYDADNAGSRAALRSLPLLETAGLTARVAVLPAGHDPDSLLREKGPEALADCLDAARPFVDYQMEFLLSKYGLDSEAGRRQVWHGAVEVLAQLRSPVEADRWRRRLAELWAGEQMDRAGLVEADLLRAVQQRRRADARAEGEPAAPQVAPAAPAQAVQSRLAKLEMAVLRASLEDRDAARRVLSAVPPERFSSPDRRRLAARIEEKLPESDWDSSLWVGPEEDLQSLVSRLLTSPEPPPAPNDLEEYLSRLQSHWSREEYQSLRRRMLEGETLDPDELQQMLRLARQLRT